MEKQLYILVAREILLIIVCEHISLKLFFARIVRMWSYPVTTYITELNFLGRFSLLSEW